jgi:hypothetical protein
MVNRVLRDDPSKSDMHNRQGLTSRMIWQAISDWRMYPLYALGLTHFSWVDRKTFDSCFFDNLRSSCRTATSLSDFDSEISRF